MALLAAVALFGCQKKQPEPTADLAQPQTPLAELDKPPAQTGSVVTDPYATDPYARDALMAPQDAVQTTRRPSSVGQETTLIGGSEKTGARTHVVQKGDTLYKLARQYYGDQSKWKDIWEANRNRVPDKNKLEVGTKLIIP